MAFLDAAESRISRIDEIPPRLIFPRIGFMVVFKLFMDSLDYRGVEMKMISRILEERVLNDEEYVQIEWNVPSNYKVVGNVCCWLKKKDMENNDIVGAYYEHFVEKKLIRDEVRNEERFEHRKETQENHHEIQESEGSIEDDDLIQIETPMISPNDIIKEFYGLVKKEMTEIAIQTDVKMVNFEEKVETRLLDGWMREREKLIAQIDFLKEQNRRLVVK